MTLSTDGRPPAQWSDSELTAFDAAHHSGPCADAECAALPAGSELFGSGMACTPDGRLVLVHGDVNDEAVRRHRATRWQQLCEAYDAHPDQFLPAHSWLTHHPVFGHLAPDRHHPSWDQLVQAATTPVPAAALLSLVEEVEAHSDRRHDRGLADLYMCVGPAGTADENGHAAAQFLLEHGPVQRFSDTLRAHLADPARREADELSSVPTDPEHLHRLIEGVSTHDTALDVFAGSYEAAIIALAARVRTRYGHTRDQVTA